MLEVKADPNISPQAFHKYVQILPSNGSLRQVATDVFRREFDNGQTKKQVPTAYFSRGCNEIQAEVFHVKVIKPEHGPFGGV